MGLTVGMCGMGKLGLPVALAIEAAGHVVKGYDVMPDPSQHIKKRWSPNVEVHVPELLAETRIEMVEEPIELMACDLVFLSIQTPHDERFDGTHLLTEETRDFDYSYLIQAIQDLADYEGVLAVISTCLPGTYTRLIQPLPKRCKYVYTPQFIAMGTVIDDYRFPEFNLIGVEDPEAAELLERFCASINDAPNLLTDITTAEGIKVSYNTWITAKTVIANTWGEIAAKTGMNVDDLCTAWGLSTKRILNPRYMRPGMSDGGGCHPRDNIALSDLAKRLDLSHDLFRDLMQARQDTETWHARQAMEAAGDHDLPLILLGRAFKPGVQIESGSAAILMANILTALGAEFEHHEDLDELPVAVYFIATDHPKYRSYEFPAGSVIINPAANSTPEVRWDTSTTPPGSTW